MQRAPSTPLFATEQLLLVVADDAFVDLDAPLLPLLHSRLATLLPYNTHVLLFFRIAATYMTQ